MGIMLDLQTDRHFLSTPVEFAEHAKGHRPLRLEYFYRELRRKLNILMDGQGPEGARRTTHHLQAALNANT